MIYGGFSSYQLSRQRSTKFTIELQCILGERKYESVSKHIYDMKSFIEHLLFVATTKLYVRNVNTKSQHLFIAPNPEVCWDENLKMLQVFLCFAHDVELLSILLLNVEEKTSSIAKDSWKFFDAQFFFHFSKAHLYSFFHFYHFFFLKTNLLKKEFVYSAVASCLVFECFSE